MNGFQYNNPVTQVINDLKRNFRGHCAAHGSSPIAKNHPEKTYVAPIIYCNLSESDGNCCVRFDRLINTLGKHIFSIPGEVLYEYIRTNNLTRKYDYKKKNPDKGKEYDVNIIRSIAHKYFVNTEEAKMIYDRNKKNKTFRLIYNLK
jgi:hypothetical protein